MMMEGHCAFSQGLRQLTQLIFAKAQPKRLGPQVITGPMLAGLATAYVDAINHGAVPTISTAWQARQPSPYLPDRLPPLQIISVTAAYINAITCGAAVQPAC